MKYKSWTRSFLLALSLATFSIASTGCCKRPVLRVKATRTDCYDVPRPQLPGPLFEPCEGFEACLTFENADKLERYMRALNRWARQIELACSENPEVGENR